MKINGFYGEEIATQYLKEKGYQILERNFQKKLVLSISFPYYI
jgi:Holliday junction resolvase-like predicted endonuclease